MVVVSSTLLSTLLSAAAAEEEPEAEESRASREMPFFAAASFNFARMRACALAVAFRASISAREESTFLIACEIAVAITCATAPVKRCPLALALAFALAASEEEDEGEEAAAAFPFCPWPCCDDDDGSGGAPGETVILNVFAKGARFVTVAGGEEASAGTGDAAGRTGSAVVPAALFCCFLFAAALPTEGGAGKRAEGDERLARKSVAALKTCAAAALDAVATADAAEGVGAGATLFFVAPGVELEAALVAGSSLFRRSSSSCLSLTSHVDPDMVLERINEKGMQRGKRKGPPLGRLRRKR